VTRGGRRLLNAGDVYFIPPGIEHGFVYKRKPADFLTLKVAVLGRDGGTEILFAQQSRVLAGIRRALLEATPVSGAPAPSRQATIELLAAALIANCYPDTDAPISPGDAAPEIPLVAAIKLYVSSAQGRVPSVKAVARRMGYSISHVTARFRAAAGIPLKRYLDEERRRAAEWLMSYSDQSIGDVAQLLEFPDIYSFSRFFKRMTGKSPRDFRRGRGEHAEAEA
jgi:AraC family transcriptional activator of pobA